MIEPSLSVTSVKSLFGLQLLVAHPEIEDPPLTPSAVEMEIVLKELTASELEI